MSASLLLNDGPTGHAIGVEYGDFLPYSRVTNADANGLLIDILAHIHEQTGLEFKLYPALPMQLNGLLVEERIVLRFPDNPAWDYHGPTKIYSDPLVPFNDQYFCQTDKEPDLSMPVSVGTITGFTLPVDETRKYVSKRVDYNDNRTLCDALDSGQVDVIYGNAMALRRAALDYPWLRLKTFHYFPPRHGYYHISALRENATVLLTVNDWIRQNRKQLDAWQGEDNFAAPATD